VSDDARPEEPESADSALDERLADELALHDGTDPRVPDSDGAPPPPAPAAESPAGSTADASAGAPGEHQPRHAGPVGDDAQPTTGRRARRRAAKQQRKRKKAPWWELPALALFAIVVAILVKTFIVQPFYIPSQSMEKTLHGCPGCSGDRILVNKPIYDLRDPHPGDIVVFHAPQGWDDEPRPSVPGNPVLKVVRGFGQLIGFVPPDDLVLVKRVIATGGQTVKGTADGSVYVSKTGPGGQFRKLDEPYVFEDGTDGHAAFGPVTVPKGRLWVMGDHRNDSADSRFHCDDSGSGSNTGATCDPQESTVPIGKVIGKAFIIAWPPSRWRTLGTPATFKQAAFAVNGAIPVGGAAVVTLPLWLLRRRRRRWRRGA
jgi:signal peptidase I